MTQLENNEELRQEVVRILKEAGLKRKSIQLTIKTLKDGKISKFDLVNKVRRIEQIKNLKI